MRSRLTATLLTIVATALVVLGPLPLVAGAATSAPTVTLTGQTNAVVASLSGQSPFTLSLAVHGTSDDVSVATTLYGRLTTRSGLEAALSKTGPTQMLDETKALPYSCLPASPHGGAALSIDVITTSATTPTLPGGCTGATPAPTLDLHCVVGNGSCNGVYPLTITVEASNKTISTMVTLLTFTEQNAEVPLRVSTVLKLSPSSLSDASTAGVAKALVHASTVPLDLAIAPKLVQRLEVTATGRASLTALAGSVAAAPPTREVLASPYVSVDPGVLAASGLSDQLAAQLRRGGTILRTAGLAPTNTSTWVATAPVTASTTPLLAAAGLSHLILPDSSLALPTDTSLYWGQPFSVDPGSSSVGAMAADGMLAQEASSGTVLGAMRLLGDLAFLHFERPSLSAPQGVVIEPSAQSSSLPFLNALLGGLEANPVLEPTTLTGLFAQVRSGANGAPTSRKLADTSSSTPWSAAQQTALTSTQQRRDAFSSAVPPSTPVLQALDDQLLGAEADTLTSGQRSFALAATSAALDHQIAQISISGNDITITALRSSIPITLTSQTGYRVKGILRLTSAHIDFPQGAAFAEVLSRPTQSLRIEVVAVTTGDLPLYVSLHTPEGNPSAPLRRDGRDGLYGAGRAGRRPKLSAEQLDQVETALANGPEANGYATDLWTLKRVAEVIERVSGVTYHPAHVWHLLRDQLGWTWQRPARRAIERNDEAIERWVKRRWPQIKKPHGARTR